MPQQEGQEIREMIGDLAVQIIQGDLHVRELGVREFMRNRCGSQLLVTDSVSGNLSLSVNVQDESGFWFIVFKREQWTALRFDSKVAFKPILNRAELPRTQVSLYQPAPIRQFDDRRFLKMQVAADDYLWASFRKNRTWVAFEHNPAELPTSAEFRRVEKLHPERVCAVLSALTGWLAEPAKSKLIQISLKELKGAKGSPANAKVLGQVIHIFEDLVKLTREENWSGLTPGMQDLTASKRRLERIHVDLAPSYRIAAFDGSIAMWITSTGDIAKEDESDRSLKIGYRFVLKTMRSGLHLYLKPFIPDFHVEGPYFDKLIHSLLRHPDAIKEVVRAKLFSESEIPAIRDFFSNGEVDMGSAVLRIKRKSAKKDKNLILIRGGIEGSQALFVFSMEVEGIDLDQPRLDDIQLISGFNGKKKWLPWPWPYEVPDSVAEYLSRLLRTMHFWSQLRPY